MFVVGPLSRVSECAPDVLFRDGRETSRAGHSELGVRIADSVVPGLPSCEDKYGPKLEEQE